MNVKKRILFVLLSLLIAAALVESAARLVHIVHPLYKNKTSLWVEHSTFHHWHAPGIVDRSRADSEEYDVSVRTNSFGMPGVERNLEKQAGVYRIALLGDSFVEGFTTSEKDSIAVLLEELLNESPTEKHEVLNFGCSSFSPSLEYYLLRDLAHDFRPDMVVLLFHVTDVSNDWEYEKLKALDSNGRVAGIDGHRAKGPLYAALERSVFLRAVVQRIKLMRRQERLREGEELHLTNSYFAMFKAEYSELDERAWELTKSYLRRIREWSDNAGVPFLIAAIPVGPQVEAFGASSETGTGFPEDWNNLQSTRMQDVLAEWTTREGVEYLDLLPFARAHKEENADERLFYPRDQHFSPAGNRVAARAILEKMTEIAE